MKKCCCCVPLPRGVCLVGGLTFFFTLAIFVVYLVFIEDIRRYVLQDYYEIVPCSRPDIDCLVDSLFEYSLLANLLLVMMCTGCTRWLLMPWLIMYAINIVALIIFSIMLFVYPMPIIPAGRPEFPVNRCLGLAPLTAALIFSYCWLAVNSLFNELSSPEKREEDRCCPMQLKTGVQIIAGVLAIISSVILVAFYARLEEMINEKYERMMKSKPSPHMQTIIATCIIVAIVTNLLVIVGGSGKRWRRAFLLPWLIFYGLGVLVSIVAHQWLTTLCWVEEKIYGLISLVIGFLTLVVWTLVWIVAAEAGEKPKTVVGRNTLGFQRL